MKTAKDYLFTLDAGRDHKAHGAFKRLVEETEAPIHGGDLRPLFTWLAGVVDQLDARVTKLEQRQDANKHNPPERPDPPPARDPEPE